VSLEDFEPTHLVYPEEQLPLAAITDELPQELVWLAGGTHTAERNAKSSLTLYAQ
jgi:hypothetical protein